MITVKTIKTLQDGVAFSGTYVLKSKNQRTAKNGNPFFVVEFSDASGQFGTTVFGDAPAAAAIESCGDGDVVDVAGNMAFYQGRPSPKIRTLEKANVANLTAEQLEALMEVAPAGTDALRRELSEHIAAIPNVKVRTAVMMLVAQKRDFATSPAATSMHHNYRSGLIEHTCSMARICRAVAPMYGVDLSILLASVILHDIGKVEEYKQGMASGKTVEGILRSHLYTGAVWARQALTQAGLGESVIEHIEHCIISHHGELEYGAITVPATPEAVLLNRIDDMDAKMGCVLKLIRDAAPGAEITDKTLMLGTNLVLRRPAYES